MGTGRFGFASQLGCHADMPFDHLPENGASFGGGSAKAVLEEIARILRRKQAAPFVAQALRKEYPNYSQLTGLSVNANGLEKSRGHSFRSKGDRWVVNLRASTISLETSFYDAFSDFEDRLKSILSAAQKIIDTEYFTRIGLRYINSVPFKRQELGSWVNPVLVGPLAQGIYGDAEEHSQRVSGRTECGGFLFTHGITQNSEGAHADYLLDFDFFQEDVAVKDSMEVVKRLHTAEFSMFMWSLAEKAKNELGQSTIKTSGAK